MSIRVLVRAVSGVDMRKPSVCACSLGIRSQSKLLLPAAVCSGDFQERGLFAGILEILVPIYQRSLRP